MGILVIFIISLAVFSIFVAFATATIKKVWIAKEKQKYKRQQKQWKKFQAKQDRIDSEMWDSHHRQESSSANSKADKFANNPDWKWDEKSQLWRHRSQWDKIK